MRLATALDEILARERAGLTAWGFAGIQRKTPGFYNIFDAKYCINLFWIF